MVNGELGVLLAMEGLSNPRATRDAGDYKALTFTVRATINSCLQTVMPRMRLSTGDDEKTLHLVDSSLTMYKGIMMACVRNLDQASDMVDSSNHGLRTMCRTFITEVEELLQAAGLKGDSRALVYMVGDKAFAGLDSKGNPVFGAFEQAFTVCSITMRYIVEGVLQAKKCEFQIEEMSRKQAVTITRGSQVAVSRAVGSQRSQQVGRSTTTAATTQQSGDGVLRVAEEFTREDQVELNRVRAELSAMVKKFGPLTVKKVVDGRETFVENPAYSQAASEKVRQLQAQIGNLTGDIRPPVKLATGKYGIPSLDRKTSEQAGAGSKVTPVRKMSLS